MKIILTADINGDMEQEELQELAENLACDAEILLSEYDNVKISTKIK